MSFYKFHQFVYHICSNSNNNSIIKMGACAANKRNRSETYFRSVHVSAGPIARQPKKDDSWDDYDADQEKLVLQKKQSAKRCHDELILKLIDSNRSIQVQHNKENKSEVEICNVVNLDKEEDKNVEMTRIREDVDRALKKIVIYQQF